MRPSKPRVTAVNTSIVVTRDLANTPSILTFFISTWWRELPSLDSALPSPPPPFVSFTPPHRYCHRPSYARAPWYIILLTELLAQDGEDQLRDWPESKWSVIAPQE